MGLSRLTLDEVDICRFWEYLMDKKPNQGRLISTPRALRLRSNVYHLLSGDAQDRIFKHLLAIVDLTNFIEFSCGFDLEDDRQAALADRVKKKQNIRALKLKDCCVNANAWMALFDPRHFSLRQLRLSGAPVANLDSPCPSRLGATITELVVRDYQNPADTDAIDPLLQAIFANAPLKKLVFRSMDHTSAALSLAASTVERLKVDYVSDLGLGVAKPNLRHLILDVRDCDTSVSFLSQNVPPSLHRLEIMCQSGDLGEVCGGLHMNQEWTTTNLKQLTVSCGRTCAGWRRPCNIAKLSIRCASIGIMLDVIAGEEVLVDGGRLHASIPEVCADCVYEATTSDSSDEEETESN